MTKIKDIKGVSEKLRVDFSYGSKHYFHRETVFNTDIEVSECVEVDVEKLKKIINSPLSPCYRHLRTIDFILEEVANAGIIKWKEDKC